MKDKVTKKLEELKIDDISQKLKDNKKKIIKRLSILTIVGIIGAGALGVSVFTYAKSKINYNENQLKEIALNKIPGEVIKVKKEFNEDDFTFEYEFKIKDKENILREITVNTNSGAITDFNCNDENE